MKRALFLAMSLLTCISIYAQVDTRNVVSEVPIDGTRYYILCDNGYFLTTKGSTLVSSPKPPASAEWQLSQNADGSWRIRTNNTTYLSGHGEGMSGGAPIMDGTGRDWQIDAAGAYRQGCYSIYTKIYLEVFEFYSNSSISIMNEDGSLFFWPADYGAANKDENGYCGDFLFFSSFQDEWYESYLNPKHTFKLRLTNSNLYFALNSDEDDGGNSNIESAACLTNEEGASVVTFSKSGDGFVIKDARTDRSLGKSKSFYGWNLCNTSSTEWSIDEEGDNIYIGCSGDFWKVDDTTEGSYIYCDGHSKTISWTLEEYKLMKITDNENYSNKLKRDFEEIIYTRTFDNTEWQALYVPFQMSYEDWCDEFEVAKINMFHQYDRDEDGTPDDLELEVFKVKSGTLKPNHPYLIKALTTGEKTITVENATLFAAEQNSFVCNSMETTYTFTGTYTGVSGADMYTNHYYSMGGGALVYAEDASAALKPYRWYLKMTDREGQVIPAPNRIRVMEWNGQTTGVESLSLDNAPARAMTLDGRSVRDTKARGLYIVNGKKVLR